jgi:excisionase family DNA binding protein
MKTVKTRKGKSAIRDGAPKDGFLSLKGTQELLTISPATLYRRIKDGTLPTVKFGRRTLIRRSAIENALIEG